MAGWNKDSSWPRDMLLLIYFRQQLKYIMGTTDLEAEV